MKARFFALAALVLGLASCQQEFDGAATVGGEVDFQLKVDARELATRAGENGAADQQHALNSAFGAIDYYQATNWDEVDLRYTLEVFDAKDDYSGDVYPVKDRQVIIVDEYESVAFDLRLVPNREYRFVVFADFVADGEYAEPNDPSFEYQADLGLHHTIGYDLRDIKVKNNEDAINEECSDAYFASEVIKISNSAAQDIVLTRPYAKVRVIATDLHELNINVDPAKVEVVYENAHVAAFNAVTGTIDRDKRLNRVEYEDNYAPEVTKMDLSKHYYNAGYDEYKEENIDVNANGVERHKYMTLFTDYILADGTQEPIHFTMTVSDKEGKEIKTTSFYTDIPVERNHLTTVIGNVLTTATEINVTIDDNFEGEYNVNYVGVASARELQEALNNVKAGETNVINFEADINAVEEKINTVIITESAETTINLIGNDYKFNGCMQIKGMSEYKNAHTVFTNINFETTDASTFMGDAFIYCDDEPNTSFRYPDSVTIKDCSFTAAGNAEKKAVGAKFWSLENNFIVENCSATGMHSLIQLTSCGKANVTVDGATIENSNNGISLGEVTTATIKDVDINAIGYGIRLNGGPSVTTTIENAKIAAFIPVNVRKLNNEAYNVKVEFLGEENELTGNTYEIAFCSNEYEEGVAPVAPVGTFTLQNAEEARAYYGDITSFSAFDAAVNSTNNDTVVLEAAVKKVGLGIEVERDVTIDFAGYEYNAGSDATSRWYALEIFGDYDVNIKNANFTRAGIYAGDNANVVFENGTINHKPERSSRYIFCAQSGATITILDGTFNNDRNNNTYFWADNSTIIVEGGNFGGVASNKKVYLTNGGQVIIKGGTFNFDPTAWVVATSVVEKVGSNWVVTPIAPSNDIADAISNVEDGGKIVLTDGAYNMPAVNGKEVTIVGSKDVIITVNKPNMSGSDVTFEGVTVKGSGYSTGVQHVNTVTYNNVNVIGEMCLYGEAVTFNNCQFELNSQYIWTYGCKNTSFNNCVFNTNGKAILVYNEGAGACEVVVNGCTFNATAGAKAGAIANQNCAAIEIDNFQNSGVGAAHKVTTSNNTCNNNFSGEWRIKNFVAGNAITVNGVEYNQIAVDGKLMTIDADKNVTVNE